MCKTKLLQIRGVNSSGKTTCMKSFIAHHGLQLECDGEIPYYFDGKYCVLGDYSKGGCCGAERLGGRDATYKLLLFLRDTFHPEWIIFENVVLSNTYAFPSALRKAFEGRYFAILFDADIKDIFSKISDRNDGKNINFQVLFDRIVDAKTSYLKMKYAGFHVEKVDPFSYSKGNMYQIIDGFIERHGARRQLHVVDPDAEVFEHQMSCTTINKPV